VLQAFAIAHDQVGLGDGCAVENLDVRALMKLVAARLHNRTRAVIAKNRPTVLELDHACKQLGRGCRPAVHDQFSGKRVRAAGFCDFWLQIGFAAGPLSDGYIVIHDAAHHSLQSFHQSARITP
jgi:hypothetical protein